MAQNHIQIRIDYDYISHMGWMSPDGTFVACDLTGHRVYALPIFEKFYGFVPDNIEDKHLYAEEHLLKLGWIKLTTENVYPYYCKYSTMYDSLSTRQFVAVEKWAMNNNVMPPWLYKQSMHRAPLYSKSVSE